MFKSLAAIMLVGTSAATELLSYEQRQQRALDHIYDAMSYVQVGTQEHTYLHNALVTMTMKTD